MFFYYKKEQKAKNGFFNKNYYKFKNFRRKSIKPGLKH